MCQKLNVRESKVAKQSKEMEENVDHVVQGPTATRRSHGMRRILEE